MGRSCGYTMRSLRHSCQLDSGPVNCRACGTVLASTARFCHKCGAQVASAEAAGWRTGLPWGVAGAALGALLTVVVLRLGAGSREQGAGDAPEATAPRSPLPAPDI